MSPTNVMHIETGSLPKWDLRFVELAHFVAGWSKDPKCKVGAVVVGVDKTQVAFGFNGFPAGMPDAESYLNEPEFKNRYIVHAERNALDNTAFDATAGKLYTTKPLCVHCAQSVLRKNLAQVFQPEPRPGRDWYFENLRAINLLKLAGLPQLVIYGDRYEDFRLVALDEAPTSG